MTPSLYTLHEQSQKIIVKILVFLLLLCFSFSLSQLSFWSYTTKQNLNSCSHCEQEITNLFLHIVPSTYVISLGCLQPRQLISSAVTSCPARRRIAVKNRSLKHCLKKQWVKMEESEKKAKVWCCNRNLFLSTSPMLPVLTAHSLYHHFL